MMNKTGCVPICSIMMKTTLTTAIVFLTLAFLFPFNAESATFGYLVDWKGEVDTFNADTDQMVSTSVLSEVNGQVQSGDASVTANGKYLFVSWGRLEASVYVYDLKTLKLVKDLGIKSRSPQIIMFPTPDGSKVFIVWWDEAVQNWIYDVYDGNTLEKLETLDVFFEVSDLPKQVSFSEDNNTLYAFDDGRRTATVRVYDMNTWNRTKTEFAYGREGLFSSGIESLRGPDILMYEKEKTGDGKKVSSFYVKNITTSTNTPRISAGFNADAVLSMDSKKAFAIEKHYDPSASDFIKGSELHVYDVATAQKIGTIVHAQ